MIPEYLYRYEDIHYTTGTQVKQRKFKVIKGTPCGYWIQLFDFSDDKKWISKTAKKRYAYPTEKAALTSFIARKKRQIEILKTQLYIAKIALDKGLKIKQNEDFPRATMPKTIYERRLKL